MSRPSNLSSAWPDALGGDVSIIAGQIAGGLVWKAPVRVAATGNVDIATLIGGDTIDGVVVAEADRVLLPANTDASENGIYDVPASGTATRALDMDSPSEFPGAFVPVVAGTANSGTLFRCTNATPPELGVDDVTFEEFGADPSLFLLRAEGGQDDLNPGGTMGAAITVDPTDGNVFYGTLDQACTATISAPVGSGQADLYWWITQDGTGGHALTIAATGGTVTLDAGADTPDTTAGVTVRYLLSRIPGTTNDWVVNLVGGGASALTVSDEGTPLATAATTLDFVGAGVAASGTGATKTITIPGVTAAGVSALGFVGPILISDTPSTPLVFADLLQNEAQDDLVYADV